VKHKFGTMQLKLPMIARATTANLSQYHASSSIAHTDDIDSRNYRLRLTSSYVNNSLHSMRVNPDEPFRDVVSRSVDLKRLERGGNDNFRSRDRESIPSGSPDPPSTYPRDSGSMCVEDPVGSGSLAVLTGNTMDPLFSKPRRLP